MTHIWASPSSCLHIYNSIQSIYGIYMDPPSLHSRIYDSVQSIFNLYTIPYSIYMTHIWSSPYRHLHIYDSIQYIFSTYIAHIWTLSWHYPHIYDSVQFIFNPYMKKISQPSLEDWLIFFYLMLPFQIFQVLAIFFKHHVLSILFHVLVVWFSSSIDGKD